MTLFGVAISVKLVGVHLKEEEVWVERRYKIGCSLGWVGGSATRSRGRDTNCWQVPGGGNKEALEG